MKKIILSVTAAGILATLGFLIQSRFAKVSPPPDSWPQQTASQEVRPAPSTPPADHLPAQPTQVSPATRPVETTPPVTEAAATAHPASGKQPGALIFDQALGTLLTPEAGFVQKQEAWRTLRDAGKLDLAISQLEQQAATNRTVAEYPAVLGQAYLQKAGTLKDIREQGILGMKADQSFDAALNLDASNWEARFWKAAAMSYWPPMLGKGKEVIEHCLELVKQQETRPTQPEYAQTYVLLGEQYEREGYADYATQAWRRGMTLFPEHPVLKQKLTPTR
jgi:tetratricopeptide (TPR) repeat protein